MSLPNWIATQRRDTKGLKAWCAMILEGEHPLLGADRLVPVVRIKGLPEWRAGDAHTFHRVDVRDKYWWSEPGKSNWVEKLQSAEPGLIMIREMIVDGGSGGVGRHFGVFEIEKTIMNDEIFHIRTGQKVAEVNT